MLRISKKFILLTPFLFLFLFAACEQPKSSESIDSNSTSIVEEFAVRYDANGGHFEDDSEIKEIEVKKGSLLTKADVPTKTGYTFTGWFDNNDQVTDTNGNVLSAWTVDSDTTLIANWTANEYLVTFNCDGGTLSLESKSVTYNEAYTLPIPTKTGYTFNGWLDDEQQLTNEKGQSLAVWNIASDTTLTAKWIANVYELTLSNTNEKAGSVSGNGTYAYNADVIVTATANEGYSFVGWYNSNGLCVSVNYSYTFKINSNESLTAKWLANEYLVSFNYDGGLVTLENKKITYNEAYSLPVPTKAGYTFNGWYNENNQLTNEKGQSLAAWNIASDTILTAKWSINDYELTLANTNENAGSVSGDGTYAYDSNVIVTATTNKGYSFVGWYDTNDLCISINSQYTFTVKLDMTLIAKWTANEYLVTFNCDGGTLSLESKSVTYNETYTLPVPTRRGYTFLGWYNEEQQLTDENGQSLSKYYATGNMTLTAKWTVNDYKLTLSNTNENAGSVSGSGTYTYGTNVTIYATANEGYGFIGWYKNGACVSTNNQYTFTMGLDTLLNAKWGPIITLNYVVDGKTVYTDTYTLGNHLTNLYQYPTNDNFYGWYKYSTFNSNDTKITSTRDLQIEDYTTYLYGT